MKMTNNVGSATESTLEYEEQTLTGGLTTTMKENSVQTTRIYWKDNQCNFGFRYVTLSRLKNGAIEICQLKILSCFIFTGKLSWFPYHHKAILHIYGIGQLSFY